MPVLDVKLNIALPAQALDAVVAELTRALGESLDRLCANVMVSSSHGPLHINGSSAPAAFVEVRSAVELGLEAKRCLCQRVATILASHCAIEPGRVFLQLSRVAPEDAWNLTPRGAECVLDRMRREPSATLPAVRRGPIS